MKDTDASVVSGQDCGAKLSDSKLLVRVLGFVANIEDYMLAAHVLVSKAGLPRSLSFSLYFSLSLSLSLSLSRSLALALALALRALSPSRSLRVRALGAL